MTNSGGLAIVVTDDVSDDGRTVAIGSNVLLRTLDQLPEFATISHESGDSTVEAIEYRDGYAHINISHFSTNTVTFQGEVHLTGDPALDGTSYNYGLQDLDSVGSYSINVTGNTAYERENQSAQVGDGETIPLSIAGTTDPVGPDGTMTPEIVLEGTETTSLFSTSGGPVTAGDSTTWTLGGNQDPRDAAITFEGDRTENARTVSGTAVSDGYSKDYSVGGNLPAESETVTFTGVETTGSQTTDSGTDGGTIDPTGNLAPVGPSTNNEPEITFKGNENTQSDNYAANGVSLDHTKSISVDGNLPPTDGSGGDPQLSVTANLPSGTYNPMYDEGAGNQDRDPILMGSYDNDLKNGSIQIQAPKTAYIRDLTLNLVSGGSDYEGALANIYIDEGKVDNDWKQGTQVKSDWDFPWSSGKTTVDIADYKVEEGQYYHIDFITQGQAGSGNYDVMDISTDYDMDYNEYWLNRDSSLDTNIPDMEVTYSGEINDLTASDGSGHSNSFGGFSDGQTKTGSLNLDTSSSQIDFSSSGAGYIDYTLTMEERTGTEDPRVDIDGDSTADASASGVLASGETATVELAALGETSQTVDTWTATAGPAPDWDITYSPHYATENPALDIDGDGTDEASHTGQIQPGNTETISVDGLEDGMSYTASTSLKSSDMAVDWDLDFTEPTAVENPGVDTNQDGTDDATYIGTLDAGENATETISDGLLTTGSNSVDFSQDTGPAYNYSLEATEVYHTTDPDVDVDGDGTYEVTYSGTLSPGTTATYDVSELTLQSDQLSIVTNEGSEVIAEAQYRERTETEDVTISVNGNPTSYDLTIGDGETKSLAVNESWLDNGTNTVEVSVAPSLGSDAPQGQVGLDYYHTAEDLVETEYKGETWTERYNVSKTWANSKENASISIPFDSSHVIGIRDLMKTVNNGSTEPIDAANYSLEGTTLTAELGDVQAGDEIRVHANGTKVLVGNGEITVTDPTIEGNVLDTGFRIDQHDPGFYLEVSGTATPDRVHHLETLSWTGADPYTEHDANGDQYLYAPNATAGGEARVQTMPLEVEPARGDVHIHLEDDNESHPIFRVEPGDELGDEVEFGYYNTTSGETYVLNSISEGIARDTQTAESPVWLLDDDSPETLEIYKESQETDGSGGASDDGTQYISPVSSDAWYESLPVVSIAAAVGLAIVAGISNYLFKEWWKILGTVGAAALLELVLLTEFIWPEVILSPLATGVREIAPTVAFILAGTIAYVIYKRWGDITGGGGEDAVTVSDDGVLRLRRD